MSGRKLAAGCAAGALIGIGGWAAGPGAGAASAAAAAAAGAAGAAASAASRGANAAARAARAVGEGVRAAARAANSRTYTDGVNDYTYHGARRAMERGISPERIDQVMRDGVRSSGHTAAETIIELTTGGQTTRVVVDSASGRIVTVMNRGKR